MAEGPLRDVRILDLTHVWAGPLATRVLADLGAQVLKVEAPMGRGPRSWPPGTPIGGFIGGEPGDEPFNTNAVFVKLQRNKKSLVLNLKHPNGRGLFLQLVAICDVVIENFSARAMERLDLGYAQLKEANPKIIHVAMPGYGLTGPYTGRVAFGPTVEPMSGLHFAMGYGPDEPRATAMAMPDPSSACNATAAVLTALRRREKTGLGMQVEMSLHESAVSYAGPWLLAEQLGEKPERYANKHPEIAPHGVYPCAGDDEWIAVACTTDKAWSHLQSLLADPRLMPQWQLSDRLLNQDAIDQALTAWTATKPGSAIFHEFQAIGVAAGIVNDTPRMNDDPHVQDRGFFVPLESGIPMPGNPIKMEGISPDDWTPCPKFGMHNREVLSEWLNLSDTEIQSLYDDAVVHDLPPR